MKVWWAGLQPRERAILAGGAVVLGILVLWMGIWEPIAEERGKLRTEVSGLATDLAWMQQVSDQVRRRAAQQGSQGAGRAAGGSVLTLVEVSATAAGIRQSIERVQPEGQGARLWFDQVGFDALINWLAELEGRHGLQVSQLAVDVSADTGTVSARLLVEPR
jgi:general secretion pathway protein M